MLTKIFVLVYHCLVLSRDALPSASPFSIAVRGTCSFKRTSFRERVTTERKGALMGVELGETSTAEQDALENLISDYSFHDASIGIISLVASIYYFSVLARNDVNVLTLLAVAVVAGLNQEVRVACDLSGVCVFYLCDRASVMAAVSWTQLLTAPVDSTGAWHLLGVRDLQCVVQESTAMVLKPFRFLQLCTEVP